ncbi:hypothetical protein R1flu_010072 [Riccia fluitans]|uniref:DUF659 domain-containing protein n=1 Tax=Riccia fluitans TaxID=41844 RepID=A0ABD1Z4R0_9MARC
MFLKAIDASNKVKTATWQAKHLAVEIRGLDPTNILQFVVDNASVNMKTEKLLYEEFPHIQWDRCVAHGLNLLCEDIGKLEWIEDLFKMCAEKVKYVKNHHMMNTMFLDDFSDGLTLLKSGLTRFMTNFIMINRAYAVRYWLRKLVNSGICMKKVWLMLKVLGAVKVFNV